MNCYLSLDGFPKVEGNFFFNSPCHTQSCGRGLWAWPALSFFFCSSDKTEVTKLYVNYKLL